jgi:hypothetical protein
MAIGIIIDPSGVMNIVACDRSFVIPKSHINYEKIKQAVRNGLESELPALCDVTTSIYNFTVGDVDIKDGVVYYKNEKMTHRLAEKIIAYMQEGFPYKHLGVFFGNLMSNPSFRAVNETFEFLEHKNMPITDDGHFYAYKKVRSDYLDWWSGTISNKPGTLVSMPRNQVDDDSNKDCSYGYHVGSIRYVQEDYHKNEGKIILVKVNPANVVSVPYKDSEKCRVCEYLVVADYTGALNESQVYCGNKAMPLTISAGKSPWAANPYVQNEPMSVGKSDLDKNDDLDDKNDDLDDDDDDLDDDDDDLDDDDDDKDEEKSISDFILKVLKKNPEGLTSSELAYSVKDLGDGNFSYDDVIITLFGMVERDEVFRYGTRYTAK